MNTSRPRLYAVVGASVKESLSPAIHHHFAMVTQKRVAYSAISVPDGDFAGAVSGFWREGGAGVNVTVPFKGEAARLADRLSSMARKCGVANVLQRRKADGRVLGFNTDGAGLVADLQRAAGKPLSGARILLVGAGGAAKGVLPSLAGQKPRLVTIANRTADRARRLAEELHARGDTKVEAAEFAALSGGHDLVINATSCGHQGIEPGIPKEALRGASLAYDMNYGEAAKPFLALATRCGCPRASDGLGMLVEQAALSFSIWEHVRPTTARLIRLLRERA